MAIDAFEYLESDTLVLPKKRFYPLSIHVAHYQLRNYISSFEQGIIYYADRENVYCLDIDSNRRSLVASLPFESRCTASGHGWICIGGEDEGQFAAIKLDGDLGPGPSEVDATLPLDLGLGARSGTTATNTKPKIHFDRVGDQIVNSISVHKLPREGVNGEDEVVAVLTNNDKTVRIYSLARSVQTAQLSCPFAMNHASISPDGSLLVAVGDEQTAFFYERKQFTETTQEDEDSPASTPLKHSQWSLVTTARLHCPKTREDIGYFSTAWSPSGTLCAVGSECGYISIFDTSLLTALEAGEDAIIEVIRSTRADVGQGPGSVRNMLFTQPPWDLLVWSEDQGRVCVVDLRDNFSVRQVLHLDASDNNLLRTEVIDSNEEAELDLQQLSRGIDQLRNFRRALDAEGNGSSFSYTDTAPERRRFPTYPTVVESDNDPHGLTSHEQQILEAINITRHHASASVSSRGMTPRSINYGNSNTVSGVPNTEDGIPAAPRSTAPESGSRNLGYNLLSLSQIRDSLRDRYSDSERRMLPPHLQALEPAISVIAASDQRERTTSPATYGWPLIEASLMSRARESSTAQPTLEFATTSEMRRFRALNRERERLQIRHRELDPNSRYNLRRGIITTTHDPAHGVRTAGLAASEDGRMIFVGAEDGIYIFSIDTKSRRMFPAICLR